MSMRNSANSLLMLSNNVFCSGVKTSDGFSDIFMSVRLQGNRQIGMCLFRRNENWRIVDLKYFSTIGIKLCYHRWHIGESWEKRTSSSPSQKSSSEHRPSLLA